MQEMMDFHSHILPGADDGSRSVEESLAMLKMAAEQGVRHMVATPHFYAHHDDPAAFLERRAEAWQRLAEAMTRQPGLPDISLGAEVYFFRGISQSDVMEDLIIQGTRCLLVEMPESPWTDLMSPRLSFSLYVTLVWRRLWNTTSGRLFSSISFANLLWMLPVPIGIP